jgi:hypothetical protein
MVRTLLAILLSTFLCLGCATHPGPKPTFKDGTRVGIVNSLESYLTHRHITIARVDSFTKQISVNWDLPAYLNAKLTDILKTDKRFVVVVVNPSSQIQSQLKQFSNQVYSAASGQRISQSLASFIENTTNAHDLDVILTVSSFQGKSPWKMGNNPILLQGYGLLTRKTILGISGINKNWVHPYAQILVTVFKTQPIAMIGAGRPKMSKGNTENFNWPVDIKNIPLTELDKLRPAIMQYADQAVKNALRDANMDTF